MRYPRREYEAGDVAMVDGSSFISVKDNSGPCPGDNWKLLASAGKRGPRRERGKGDAGPAGRDAPTILGWHVDPANYTATPILSDGLCGPPIKLLGLFDQFFTAITGKKIIREGDNNEPRITG